MENNYVYPAYLKEEDGDKYLVFPDFEELVVGIEDDIDFIQEAQTELALIIIGYLDEGRELPKRSEFDKDAIYIHVWLPYFRNMTKEVYVKKTVTIPLWLDELAKNGKVLFSASVEDANKMLSAGGNKFYGTQISKVPGKNKNLFIPKI